MAQQLFNRILVANRSEIAVRIINACRSLGIPSVAVYSDADKNSKHRLLADQSIHIGPSPPRESYLDISRIISAAREMDCDAIHPGYGFLAESPEFAAQCVKEGMTFIGPTAEAIGLLGNKLKSRTMMKQAGVSVIEGMYASSADIEEFREVASKTGYPVMIKAAAGGGGKGMRVVASADDLVEAVEAARREAKNAFNDDSVFLEKFVVNPRHIEFQVLADHHGNIVHLFERECSIQRRHQKIIEETPSTALNGELRHRMGADAIKVARAADYTNAGTVEFLLDESGHYYFLEMNTRIQVEHPVTEMTTGCDLVVEQIKIASGQKLSKGFFNLTQVGHSIECRIYAEDGENDFMPSTGTIRYYREPSGPGIRVDSGIVENTEITIDYDPIMAKLIVHAPDRKVAIRKMIVALNEFKILGVKTSKKFMVDVLKHPQFVEGRTYTSFIDAHLAERSSPTDEVKAIAVAAASVATSEASRVGSVSTSRSGEGGATPLPWQTIGGWQVGDDID